MKPNSHASASHATSQPCADSVRTSSTFDVDDHNARAPSTGSAPGVGNAHGDTGANSIAPGGTHRRYIGRFVGSIPDNRHAICRDHRISGKLDATAAPNRSATAHNTA